MNYILGSITYAGEAGGTVSITGSVEINGSLDIIANLLLTGYLKINNGGRLSFSGEKGYKSVESMFYDAHFITNFNHNIAFFKVRTSNFI